MANIIIKLDNRPDRTNRITLKNLWWANVRFARGAVKNMSIYSDDAKIVNSEPEMQHHINIEDQSLCGGLSPIIVCPLARIHILWVPVHLPAAFYLHILYNSMIEKLVVCIITFHFSKVNNPVDDHLYIILIKKIVCQFIHQQRNRDYKHEEYYARHL